MFVYWGTLALTSLIPIYLNNALLHTIHFYTRCTMLGHAKSTMRMCRIVNVWTQHVTMLGGGMTVSL